MEIMNSKTSTKLEARDWEIEICLKFPWILLQKEGIVKGIENSENDKLMTYIMHYEAIRLLDFIRQEKDISFKEGVEKGLQMVMEVLPEEAPHDECYADHCEMCDSPRGWNSCRQEVISALVELGMVLKKK